MEQVMAPVDQLGRAIQVDDLLKYPQTEQIYRVMSIERCYVLVARFDDPRADLHVLPVETQHLVHMGKILWTEQGQVYSWNNGEWEQYLQVAEQQKRDPLLLVPRQAQSRGISNVAFFLVRILAHVVFAIVIGAYFPLWVVALILAGIIGLEEWPAGTNKKHRG
jgi:hypothetical protein